VLALRTLENPSGRQWQNERFNLSFRPDETNSSDKESAMNFDFTFHYQVLLEQHKDQRKNNSRRMTGQRWKPPSAWAKFWTPLFGSKTHQRDLSTWA
jgi:hypothetical protein